MIESIKVQEKYLYDLKGITFELCDFFANIGQKYATNIPKDITGTNEYISKIPSHEQCSYCPPHNKKYRT